MNENVQNVLFKVKMSQFTRFLGVNFQNFKNVPVKKNWQVSCLIWPHKHKHPELNTSEHTIVPRTVIFALYPVSLLSGGQTEIEMINDNLLSRTKAFKNTNQTAIYNVPALEDLDHFENHCCWEKEQSLVCVCVPHVRSENSPAGSDKVCLS